jgi:hypothetical protein
MRFHLLAALALPVLLSAEDLHWFKGNTHTHSLWSDGNDFPDMISAWYQEQGYDFLGMSDHNTLAAGERWVKESVIEKKKIALGPKVLDKYLKRFGDSWVETRTDKDGQTEVRLKTLEEYRKKLEVPGKFLLVQAEEISAGFGKSPIHINAINLRTSCLTTAMSAARSRHQPPAPNRRPSRGRAGGEIRTPHHGAHQPSQLQMGAHGR